MSVKVSARVAAVTVLSSLCVLSAPLAAHAVDNPAPTFTPNSFNAVEGTPFSGSIVVSALTGTWNWNYGNSVRFSASGSCPVGSNDVAPAGIVIANYNPPSFQSGAFTGPIVLSGTPSLGSSTGGLNSNGIYNTCVDIRDDHDNHVFQAVQITVAAPPVPTPTIPVAEPELSNTGIDSVNVQVSAIFGIVLLSAGAALLSTRRKTKKRN